MSLRRRCATRFAFGVAVMVSCAPDALARDFYVATSGSDTAAGTLAQPFRTIQRAASTMVAGDTAYIRTGIYRERVAPANSGAPGAPIRFLPYNGETVFVSGTDVIAAASWSLHSGSTYKASFDGDLGEGSNQIFVDGQMMIEARWPNTTFDVSHPIVAFTGSGSHVDGGTGLSTGTITAPDLPSKPAGYWNGATLHISLWNAPIYKGAGWQWQTGTVTASSAGQLSFQWYKGSGGDRDQITPGAGDPYYLTGKLGELDAGGEWFVDGASSTLYIQTPAGDSPVPHVVEAKRRQFAFDLRGRSHVTVQGISIFAATITSDALSEYLVLDGLTAQYVSHYHCFQAQRHSSSAPTIRASS